MTHWRKKEKRERKAYDDKAQALLAPEKQSFMRERGRTMTVSSMAFTGKYMCPFCIYIGDINKFLVSTKKGISQKRAVCPECKTGMTMRTLTQDLTIEEFAEWVYRYPMFFPKRCSFRKFSNRLFKLGMVYRFWKRYKQLKGEDTETESYDKYLERQQREEHEEAERGREAYLKKVVKYWEDEDNDS